MGDLGDGSLFSELQDTDVLFHVLNIPDNSAVLHVGKLKIWLFNMDGYVEQGTSLTAQEFCI